MKRWSRASSVGALILVAGVCATASPIAASAAAPSLSVAPRNEVSIVAAAGGTATSINDTAPTVTGTGSQATWTANGATVRLTAAAGEKFKVGTFAIGTAPGSVDADVVSTGVQCNPDAMSRITIHEVAYTGEDVTTLAATTQTRCAGLGQTAADVRFNSTVGSVRAGSLPLGQNGATKRVTFTTPEATTVKDLYWAGDLSGEVKGNTCTGATLAAAGTCYVDLAPRPLENGAEYLALSIRDDADMRLDTVSVTALGVQTSEGAYTALSTPRRVIDTRTNNTPLKGGVSRDVKVTGANGIPATGVAAVVVNITVVSPTANGNLTAYPAGVTAPTTSSVNFNRGWTGANLVTVRPGSGAVDGKIRLLTSGGTTNVIVDVVGYYRTSAGWTTTPGAFGSFQPVDPYRLYDSRQDVKANGYEIFDLWTDFGDLNAHTKALALNVTVVAPEGPGHLTVFNGLNSSSVPNTSTLNFTTGRTVPNMTIVPITRCFESWCGGASGSGPVAFTVANASSKKVHVIVDVVGVFDDNTIAYGSRFKGLASPKRILDTRSKLGFAPLTAQATGTGGTAAVRTPWTTSLSGNLTAAAPTAATALTIWSADLPRPAVSSMNPYAGQYVSNMVMPGISDAGEYKVHNGGNGTANVILDVVGTFEFYRADELAPDTGEFTQAQGMVASEARGAVTTAPDSKSLAPSTASGSRSASPALSPKGNVR